MEEIMYFQTALVLFLFSSYTAEGQEAIPDLNRLER